MAQFDLCLSDGKTMRGQKRPKNALRVRMGLAQRGCLFHFHFLYFTCHRRQTDAARAGGCPDPRRTDSPSMTVDPLKFQCRICCSPPGMAGGHGPIGPTLSKGTRQAGCWRGIFISRSRSLAFQTSYCLQRRVGAPGLACRATGVSLMAPASGPGERVCLAPFRLKWIARHGQPTPPPCSKQGGSMAGRASWRFRRDRSQKRERTCRAGIRLSRNPNRLPVHLIGTGKGSNISRL